MEFVSIESSFKLENGLGIESKSVFAINDVIYKCFLPFLRKPPANSTQITLAWVKTDIYFKLSKCHDQALAVTREIQGDCWWTGPACSLAVRDGREKKGSGNVKEACQKMTDLHWGFQSKLSGALVFLLNSINIFLHNWKKFKCIHVSYSAKWSFTLFFYFKLCVFQFFQN